MRRRGMGRLNESRIGGAITEAFAVRAAPSLESTLHARHSAGLLVGLDGEVTVVQPGRAPVRGRVVLVPPHLLHGDSCAGPAVVILYDHEVVPEVASYARLRGEAAALEGPIASRVLGAVAAHRADLARPEVLLGIARESAGWFAREAPRRPIDPRVARVLEALRDPTIDRRPVLEQTRLSPAHLQALFVRDVGLPIRSYQLWRRLLFAVASCVRLDSTSAAHAAGFADLAHFSRTCRKMLGHSPTALRRGFIKA